MLNLFFLILFFFCSVWRRKKIHGCGWHHHGDRGYDESQGNGESPQCTAYAGVLQCEQLSHLNAVDSFHLIWFFLSWTLCFLFVTLAVCLGIYMCSTLYILHYIRVTHCPSPKLMVLQPLWVAVICCLSELFYSLFSFLLLPTSQQQKNKAHGTTATPPQDNLKWGCDPKTADNICCFNRHYAEHSGYVIYIYIYGYIYIHFSTLL